MRKAALLGAIAGALGLGLVASSAVAAPVGGVAQQIEPASLVEKVHSGCFWHRHWRHGHAHRHCRRHHHHFRAGFSAFRPFIGFRRLVGFRRFHCHRRFCHRH
jgi:hypothetical protein